MLTSLRLKGELEECLAKIEAMSGQARVNDFVALGQLEGRSSRYPRFRWIARTMPQFALLMILILLPLQMLSGGVTPRESMPEFVQQIMTGAPTTHFVKLAQGIIYRAGALDVVWPQFLALALIGAVLFGVALMRFRKTIGQM